MSPQGQRSRGLPQVGAAPGSLIVDQDAPKSRLSICIYDGESLEEHDDLDVAAVRAAAAEKRMTWVNVDGLGDAELLREVAEVFDLHPLALEDAVNVFQRAKVERYGDDLFVVARMPTTVEEAIETEQVSFFVRPGLVLSFQERRGDCLEPVRERLRASRPRLRSSGSDYLVYALLDAIIDAYFPLLETYETLLIELEQRVLDRQDEEVLRDIYGTRRQLVRLRRVLSPHREIFRDIAREVDTAFSEETQLFLRDCHDHTLRLMDLVEGYRELAASLMELYLSLVGHRQNEVMKVLTIIATIFIPLSFIAGLYGMNFDTASPWNMPELSWPFGYFGAVGAMLSVAGGMLLFFRRRGWF